MCLAAVAAVVVLWPAPDPLAGAETVYVQWGEPADAPYPSDRRDVLQTGLAVVLDDRLLTLVSEREAADVALEFRDVTVDFGDVEISLRNGSWSGRVSAECRIVDLDTDREHTMDLTIRIDGERVRASLRGRRFWEFWK